jgi:hypothetical protein
MLRSLGVGDVELRLDFAFEAGRTDAVTEARVGVLGDVRFDVVPEVSSSRTRLQYEQIGRMACSDFTSASAAWS